MTESRTLNELATECFETSKSKGWHDNDTDDFPTKLCLTHSELSETLEEYRNGRGFSEIYFNESKPDKPEGIPIELADTLIRIFDMCGKYGIDINKAMEIKMAYNKTRPHRHGGKKI